MHGGSFARPKPAAAVALRLTAFKACSDSVTNSRRFQQGPVVRPGGIGGNSQLPEIKGSLPGLRSSVTFARGQQDRDFDADIDGVAAYSIGGLVAGKMLAKAGFFAVVLKFRKIGLPALAGAWAGLKRFFSASAKKKRSPTAAIRRIGIPSAGPLRPGPRPA